jgi:hypothetical protein
LNRLQVGQSHSQAKLPPENGKPDRIKKRDVVNLSEYPLQFLLPKKTPSIWFTVCRVGRNVPGYFAVLREGGEAPKVVVYFRIRKLLSIVE